MSCDVLRQPKSLPALQRHVAERFAEHCPGVKWMVRCAVLDPYDCVDVFEVPDHEAATRVSLLVRSHGRARSRVWPALERSSFKRLLTGLPEAPCASSP